MLFGRKKAPSGDFVQSTSFKPPLVHFSPCNDDACDICIFAIVESGLYLLSWPCQKYLWLNRQKEKAAMTSGRQDGRVGILHTRKGMHGGEDL